VSIVEDAKSIECQEDTEVFDRFAPQGFGGWSEAPLENNSETSICVLISRMCGIDAAREQLVVEDDNHDQTRS
jgi:hypothetical protein